MTMLLQPQPTLRDFAIDSPEVQIALALDESEYEFQGFTTDDIEYLRELKSR